MTLIALDGVGKRYGELHALKEVDLSLDEGLIGLLGPNGAGKSTLLKVLLGLLDADSGTVKVFDLDVRRHPFEVRTKVGYMPEGDTVVPDLTALEFTTLAGELCGLPRRESIARSHQVLNYVGLGEARYRKLGSFSTGMKQRVRLAQALVGDPKLLLLDEPTSGLDPGGREEMLSLIVDIPQRTGASVIVSSHILPDIEKTCDQVIVIASGEILYSGALEPLLRPEQDIYEVRTKGDPTALGKQLEDANCEVATQGTTLEVKVPSGEDAAYVLRVAHAAQQQIRHLAPLVQSLERAFLRTLASREPR